MVNFSDWLGTNSPADESFYAARAWSLIQRKPQNIVLQRGTTSLAAQTVRVTYSTEETPIEGMGGAQGSRRDVVVFGVKNHPTVTDTDIKRGDKFSYEDRLFKITDVITNLGSIQATGEAVS